MGRQQRTLIGNAESPPGKTSIMNEGCTFCEIADGEAPASLVYQDEKVLAFRDAYPVNRGHTLVIPKQHAASLADLDPEIGAKVFQLAMGVASAIRKTDIRCEGVNLILADGKAAGQDIFHIHLHIIPRYRADNFSMSSLSRSMPSREELGSVGRQITDALQ